MSRAVILLCLCALSLATPPDADIIRSELAEGRENIYQGIIYTTQER